MADHYSHLGYSSNRGRESGAKNRNGSHNEASVKGVRENRIVKIGVTPDFFTGSL